VKDITAQVVVAGHICLDIIPSLGGLAGGLDALVAPGKLINVGPAVTATGGAVSNAGLALHRLGVATRLMGKVGDDLCGRAVLDLLSRQGAALADGIIVIAGEHTSYTLVFNPPGVDRNFLHCPGANDTFGADDVAYDQLAGARLFHFGYPPAMRRMFTDGGSELESLLCRVKQRGLTVSLDMTQPDPDSDAGRADWPSLLARALPHVDIFMPSLDEILFMLDRPRFEKLHGRSGAGEAATPADGPLLGEVAGRLLELGANVVALKLGEQGLYLRTAGEGDRLASMGNCTPAETRAWCGREMLAPCFEVNVVGTTGSGDCTIAGFLAGMLNDLPPAGAMTAAVAVGACNVEQADATSGVPNWADVQRRIEAGWARKKLTIKLPGWKWDQDRAVWIGPNDSHR